MKKYPLASIVLFIVLIPSVTMGQWFTNPNGDIQANSSNAKVLTGVLPGIFPGRFNIAVPSTMPHLFLFGGPAISSSGLSGKFNMNIGGQASLGIITSNTICGGGVGMLEGSNLSSPIVWMYNSTSGYNAFTVASTNYMPGGLINGTSSIENAFNVLLQVRENGNVGIGTTSPNQKLEVDGNFLCNSENSAFGFDAMPQARFGIIKKYGFYPAIASSSGSPIVFAQTDQADIYTNISSATISERMRIASNGYVGIGTPSPDAKLAVKGQIHANEVKVDLNVPGPDYVFEKDYQLTSLEDIKNYIDQNKHLPEVPSAKEMEKNGVQLGEMNMLLLKKIEELTLHIIKQEEKIEKLEQKKD